MDNGHILFRTIRRTRKQHAPFVNKQPDPGGNEKQPEHKIKNSSHHFLAHSRTPVASSVIEFASIVTDSDSASVLSFSPSSMTSTYSLLPSASATRIHSGRCGFSGTSRAYRTF